MMQQVTIVIQAVFSNVWIIYSRLPVGLAGVIFRISFLQSFSTPCLLDMTIAILTYWRAFYTQVTQCQPVYLCLYTKSNLDHIRTKNITLS